MEDMTLCSPESREVFQRVWSRVMGERAGNCPIEMVPDNMEGDLSCACLEALERKNRAEGTRTENQTQSEQQMGNQMQSEQRMGNQMQSERRMEDQAQSEQRMENQMQSQQQMDSRTQSEQRMESQMQGQQQMENQTQSEGRMEDQTEDGQRMEGTEQSSGDRRGGDLPTAWTEPMPSDERTGRLRRQVLESLEGWQYYRHLARRTRGSEARTLNALAGDLHRQARKLAAAYFLLTGLRYWPSELLATPAITSYWGALRERHQAEQQQEMGFRIAADDWDDPDLLELYQQLVEGCQLRARQLRALLEQGS